VNLVPGEGVLRLPTPGRVSLRGAGKRNPINDSQIATTAIANHMPVASQDDDDVAELEVTRV
jgi:predicted nucleic acid-binding protein